MLNGLVRKITSRFIGQGLLAAAIFFAGVSVSAGQYGDYVFETNGSNIIITQYTGMGGDVTIPESIYSRYVTGIGSGAFGGCVTLTSIVIPERVTSIGVQAFWNCSNLKSVTIGSKVTKIESQAFWFCSSLTGILIGQRVTKIGSDAFLNCPSLASISVTSDNPTYSSIDGVLFNKAKTTLIQYPGGKIGEYVIPDTVTTIGNNAFQACPGLTSVTIGSKVKKIGDGAFYQCSSLISAYFLGKAPTTMGSGVFESCAQGFTVYFIEGAKGFSLPSWYGAPSAYFTLAVTFTAENGGLINSSAKVIVKDVGYGQNCTSVTATPDAGFHFVNWTGDVSSTSNPLVVTNVTSNQNVTANFAANDPGTFTVTFLPGDGGTVSGIASQNVVAGTNCTPMMALPDAGYHFISWDGDVSGTSNPLTVTNVTKDMNITANFAFIPEAANLTMAVSPAEGGTTAPAVGTSSQSTGLAIAITATAAPGYTFESWSVTANGSIASPRNSSTTVIIIGDTTVTANFAQSAALTMEPNPQAGGAIYPVAGAHQIGSGSAQDILATPALGYRFLNWTATANASLADATASATTAILSGDATVTANFASIPATAALSMAANPEAGGTSTPASGTVNTQEAIGITATAADGYHFLQWTASANAELGDRNNSTTTVTLYGDATVTANFEINALTATLTMEVSPVDGGTTDPAGISTQNTGTPIDITATAAKGYSFTGWSGSTADATFADSSAEITTVTISGSVTVTANFEKEAATEDMACGKIFMLGIWSVPGITDFTGSPKIYATYQLRPLDLKSKNISLSVVTKIPKGITTDSIVCEWTGIIALLDKNLWSDKTKTTRQILVENPPEPLVCRLFASATDSNGTKLSNVYTDRDLYLLPPEITDVKNGNGKSINSISTAVKGQRIVVSGKMFGKAIPAVWMEYPVYEKDGVTFKGIKQLALKVDKNSLTVNGPDSRGNLSAMNIETGIAEITVIIPDKWPKDWQPGQHNIVIDNKICRATREFQTVK